MRFQIPRIGPVANKKVKNNKNIKAKRDYFDIFDELDQQETLDRRVNDWFTQEAQPTGPDLFVCLAL
jgi:hypothetical protein